MTLTIPAWLLWMVAGYVAGRTAEALLKFLAFLDRETRGPGEMARARVRETLHRPPPPLPQDNRMTAQGANE